jgi:hypothetical protein
VLPYQPMLLAVEGGVPARTAVPVTVDVTIRLVMEYCVPPTVRFAAVHGTPLGLPFAGLVPSPETV